MTVAAARHKRPLPVYDPRAQGADCDNCPCNGQRPVPPTKKATAKLVVLAESPGRVEEYEGRPLVGPTGQWFNDVLDYFGVPRGRLHLTNAIACRPVKGMTPKQWRTAVACCEPRLSKELKQTSAKTILATGKAALLATAGKGKIMPWIGGPLRGIGPYSKYTVIPTLHPTYCKFRIPPHQHTFMIHLHRAWEMAEGRLKKWKWPTIVTEPSDRALKHLRRMKRKKRPLGFDVETAGKDPLLAKLMCVGLADKRGCVSLDWYGMNKTPNGRKCKKLIGEILADPDIPKTMHNGSHDVLTAKHNNIPLEGFNFDTLLAHAVVLPQLPHDLGFACSLEFHAPRWKTKFGEETDLKGAARFTRRDPTALRVYNSKDAYMTLLLSENLNVRLKYVNNGVDLLDEYHTLAHIGMDMQERGAPIRPDKFQHHRKTLMRRRAKALRDVRRVAELMGMREINGKPFNPHSSSGHGKKLFFEKLGVKPKKYSEKTEQPKLDADLLESLVSSEYLTVATAARSLLKYRRYDKLLRTYINGMPVVSRKGVRLVRPSWKVYGTVTGRWSSQSPNAQNIPKPKTRRLKNGKERVIAPGLRDLFGCNKGNWLVECDYSQLELRIIALLSGDEKLLEWYNAGEDVHYKNAQDLFETKEPTDKERDLAKRFVYACNYGADAETIWRSLVVDFPALELKLVRRLLVKWFIIHPKIKAWQQEQLRIARERGYVEAPISGRREYFYGPIEPTKVFNFPIQATAADIINRAIVKVWRALNWKDEGILFQVHDSLVCEGKNVVRVCTVLNKHMGAPVTLDGKSITFPVDFKVGYEATWGELDKCKDLKEVRKKARAA